MPEIHTKRKGTCTSKMHELAYPGRTVCYRNMCIHVEAATISNMSSHLARTRPALLRCLVPEVARARRVNEGAVDGRLTARTQGAWAERGSASIVGNGNTLCGMESSSVLLRDKANASKGHTGLLRGSNSWISRITYPLPPSPRKPVESEQSSWQLTGCHKASLM